MKKINLLQIAIHLTATLFFVFSFRKFFALYNIKILKITAENGVENTLHNMAKYGLTTQDIWNFTFFTTISGLIGILFSFTISVIISIQKQWSIANSLVVLISSFLLHRFAFLNWTFLPYIPKSFIDDLFVRLLIEGIVFSTIGFLIFFSKKTNRIILNHHTYKTKPC